LCRHGSKLTQRALAALDRGRRGSAVSSPRRAKRLEQILRGPRQGDEVDLPRRYSFRIVPGRHFRRVVARDSHAVEAGRRRVPADPETARNIAPEAKRVGERIGVRRRRGAVEIFVLGVASDFYVVDVESVPGDGVDVALVVPQFSEADDVAVGPHVPTADYSVLRHDERVGGPRRPVHILVGRAERVAEGAGAEYRETHRPRTHRRRQVHARGPRGGERARAADAEVHPPLRIIRSVEEVAVEAKDLDDGVRRRERRRREVEAARIRVDLRRADVCDALGQRDQRGVAGRRGVGVADDGYDRVEVHARGCTSESLCPC
ncbi:unnamed protein product, partial [Pelagomonas calceolata]